MALKDLLVYVDQTERAQERVRLAVDLAARHASHLCALFVRDRDQAQMNELKSAELGLVSAQRLHELDRQIEAQIDQAASRLRQRFEEMAAERGVDPEWRAVNGLLAIVAPQHARYADLCILPHEVQPNRASVNYSFAEQMLFVSGRPVLFVPPNGAAATLGRNVAVAWNSSRAAARAVGDAMPIIERAERTIIISANPTDYVERHGALPVAQLVEHLRRHGAQVELVALSAPSTDAIGGLLQAKALELGADLLIAGAFGQSRLWEKFLGGVTSDLLRNARMPLLMSQ